ncbi:MAG: hypothetical protein IPJ65_21520 [Archangiaceae bacterium]|nr:hypothetical protein [Archangiaceae bacterium]
MSPPDGARDVLVVLREELAAARAALREADSVDAEESGSAELARAVGRLRVTADALEVRIRGPFDAVLLDKAAASFRAAAATFDKLASVRREKFKVSDDVQRVLKRVVVHAREIGRMTQQGGAAHVGAAITSLSTPAAWSGPCLDALAGLVDTLQFLARRRLGEAAADDQVNSLVDRAASTAVVSCLHALKDLAGRVRNEPTVMKDRFQLDGALRAPALNLVDRLSAWFKLDDDGRKRLQSSIEGFIRRLLDRAAQGP